MLLYVRPPRDRVTPLGSNVTPLIDLAATAKLHTARGVADATWKALRRFGEGGHEGFVLWLGVVSGAVADVQVAYVPPQSSIRGEDGVGYFVTSETLFHLNRELHRTGLRLLAQVHSHPTDAYHSSTDDAYAVVTAEGGFSIVVPDFGAGEAVPEKCAIYRLRSSRWQALSHSEASVAMEWELP